jgi:hypothetical protein
MIENLPVIRTATVHQIPPGHRKAFKNDSYRLVDELRSAVSAWTYSGPARLLLGIVSFACIAAGAAIMLFGFISMFGAFVAIAGLLLWPVATLALGGALLHFGMKIADRNKR